MDASREYMEFCLGRFERLGVVTARKMFGGYVFHMAGRVLGFCFNDTFLFEPGPTIDRLLPDAPRQELFPGSKLFVVIDESMDSRRLCELAEACYDDFPIPKPRKRKGSSPEKERNKAAGLEKKFPFLKRMKQESCNSLD